MQATPLLLLYAVDSIIGDFTVADLQRACPDVSIDMIWHVLKKLKKEEKVIFLRQGRSARWRKAKEEKERKF